MTPLMRSVMSLLRDDIAMATDEVMHRLGGLENIRRAASVLGVLHRIGVIERPSKQKGARYTSWRSKQLRIVP